MNYANIYTGAIFDELPTFALPLAVDGAIVPTPSLEQIWKCHVEAGTRLVIDREAAPEGYRVKEWNIIPAGFDSCVLTIKDKVSLDVDKAEAKAREEEATKIADEQKAANDAAVAFREKILAGIKGSIEERIENLERLAGLRE